MAENAQEQLLGYLLDALEDDERRQIREDLSRDPQLRQQLETLRAMLGSMEPTREPVEPPPGLARRTCRFVAARAAEPETRHDPRPAGAGRLHAMRADASLDGGATRFSWLDLAAAAGILVVASLLIFPALQNSRVQARINGCAQNLHSIHQAVTQYGEAFAGWLPTAPPNDRLGVGGGFAAVIQSTGYLADPRQLLCPGSPMADLPQFAVPSPEHIRTMPEGPELETALVSVGGSYTMSMGYEEGDRFQGLRYLGRNDFALISDAPDPNLPNFRSHNHARGQNILFEGGNVQYITAPVSISQDHFYLNAAGHIGPGLNRHDSVIPPAGRVPIVFTSGR
jgi:hypothetical protein